MTMTVVDQLLCMGFDYAVGVPDSHLAPLIADLDTCIPVEVVPREDVAVAVACGLALGGYTPLLYMKNAGMFASGDALLSLARDLHIPLCLLVGWAGAGSDTLPHHVVSGERTTAFLDSLAIAWRLSTDLADAGDWHDTCRRQGQHTAILVTPGAHHGG